MGSPRYRPRHRTCEDPDEIKRFCIDFERKVELSPIVFYRCDNPQSIFLRKLTSNKMIYD